MKIEFLDGSNVVSVTPYPTAPDFRAVGQVEAYWEGLRSPGTIPTRTDIDPRGLEDALEYTFMLERIAPGVARFRLAGTHLNDLLGMEVRGMPIGAMFLPEGRAEISSLIEQVCNENRVATLDLRGARGLGRPALNSRMLLAPLASISGENPRILGCLESHGNIGRQPRRYSIDDCTVRMACPAPASKSNELPRFAFAEGQTQFAGHQDTKKPGEARPALHLVTADK